MNAFKFHWSRELRLFGMTFLFAGLAGGTGLEGSAAATATTQPAGRTWHIANIGMDSAHLSVLFHSQPITNSPDGDRILVGPDRYARDLYGTPLLSELGDEFGLCAVVCVERRVTIVSSAGAEATVIDATTESFSAVMLARDGTIFGTPHNGVALMNFMASGLSIQATNIASPVGNIG